MRWAHCGCRGLQWVFEMRPFWAHFKIRSSYALITLLKLIQLGEHHGNTSVQAFIEHSNRPTK
jgi:hypothetical protein